MKDAPVKIVLVDDDDDDCMLFREAIHEIDPDAEVVVFTRWQKLIAYLKRTSIPDIIFLDYILPGKLGNELAVELKHTDEVKDVPIVVTSGIADVRENERSSINEVIEKPSSFKELVKILRRALVKYTDIRTQLN